MQRLKNTTRGASSGFRVGTSRVEVRKPGLAWVALGVAGSTLLTLGGCVLSRPLPDERVSTVTSSTAPEKVASEILSADGVVHEAQETAVIEKAEAESRMGEAKSAKGTLGGVVPSEGQTELSREQIVNRLNEVYGSLETALRFETGDWTLSSEAQMQLREFARLLKLAPDLKVKISGFADNIGNDQANILLSRRRANAVREALVAEGVTASQVALEAMGEKAPVASNATPVGRSLNRRVEIETPSG